MKSTMQFSVGGETLQVPQDEMDEFNKVAKEQGVTPVQIHSYRVSSKDGSDVQELDVPETDYGEFVNVAKSNGYSFEPIRAFTMEDGSVRYYGSRDAVRTGTDEEYAKQNPEAKDYFAGNFPAFSHEIRSTEARLQGDTEFSAREEAYWRTASDGCIPPEVLHGISAPAEKKRRQKSALATHFNALATHFNALGAAYDALTNPESIRANAKDGNSVQKAYAYANDLANSIVSGFLGGSAKVEQAVGTLVGSDAIVQDAAAAQEAIERNLPTDMLDTKQPGVLNKVLDVGKGVASVTGEFAPAAIPGVGAAYAPSLVGSGATIRYKQIHDEVVQNGGDEALATGVASLGATVDAGMNMMLMGTFKGIWKGEQAQMAELAKQGLVRRLVQGHGTEAVKTGLTMASGGMAQDILDQAVEGQANFDWRRNIDVGKEQFVEGGLFHLVNAGAHNMTKIKWSSDPRGIPAGAARDMLEAPEGRALVIANSPEAAVKIMRARERGEDVSRSMIEGLGVSRDTAPTVKDRNAIGDRIAADYRAFKERVRTKMDDVQAAALSDEINSRSDEGIPNDIFEKAWFKAVEQIKNARELDDPDRRSAIVTEALKASETPEERAAREKAVDEYNVARAAEAAGITRKEDAAPKPEAPVAEAPKPEAAQENSVGPVAEKPVVEPKKPVVETAKEVAPAQKNENTTSTPARTVEPSMKASLEKEYGTAINKPNFEDRFSRLDELPVGTEVEVIESADGTHGRKYVKLDEKKQSTGESYWVQSDSGRPTASLSSGRRSPQSLLAGNGDFRVLNTAQTPEKQPVAASEPKTGNVPPKPVEAQGGAENAPVEIELSVSRDGSMYFTNGEGEVRGQDGKAVKFDDPYEALKWARANGYEPYSDKGVSLVESLAREELDRNGNKRPTKDAVAKEVAKIEAEIAPKTESEAAGNAPVEANGEGQTKSAAEVQRVVRAINDAKTFEDLKKAYESFKYKGLDSVDGVKVDHDTVNSEMNRRANELAETTSPKSKPSPKSPSASDAKPMTVAEAVRRVQDLKDELEDMRGVSFTGEDAAKNRAEHEAARKRLEKRIAEAEAEVDSFRTPAKPFAPYKGKPDAKKAAKVAEKFVLGKGIKENSPLESVYHDKENGVAVATDGRHLIATRHGFDPNAKEDPDHVYPKWRQVVPGESSVVYRKTVNPEEVANACKRAISLSKSLGHWDGKDFNDPLSPKVIFKVGDRNILFSARLAEDCARAMAANGITDIGFNKDGVLVARNEDATIVSMPIKIEGTGQFNPVFGEKVRAAYGELGNGIVVDADTGRVVHAPSRTDERFETSRKRLKDERETLERRRSDAIRRGRNRDFFQTIMEAQKKGITSPQEIYDAHMDKLDEALKKDKTFEKPSKRFAEFPKDQQDILDDIVKTTDPDEIAIKLASYGKNNITAKDIKNAERAVAKLEKRIADEDALEELLMRGDEARAFLGIKDEPKAKKDEAFQKDVEEGERLKAEADAEARSEDIGDLIGRYLKSSATAKNNASGRKFKANAKAALQEALEALGDAEYADIKGRVKEIMANAGLDPKKSGYVQAVFNAETARRNKAKAVSAGDAPVEPPKTSGNDDTARQASRMYQDNVSFSRPIIGRTGAKIVGYSWANKKFEEVDQRGNDIVVKRSDWEKSLTNPETNRDIVHKFDVVDNDGNHHVVSAETAAKMLGTDSGTVRGEALKLIRRAEKIGSLTDAQRDAFSRSFAKSQGVFAVKPTDRVSIMTNGDVVIHGLRGRDDGVHDRWNHAVTTIHPDGTVKRSMTSSGPKSKGFEIGHDEIAEGRGSNSTQKQKPVVPPKQTPDDFIRRIGEAKTGGELSNVMRDYEKVENGTGMYEGLDEAETDAVRARITDAYAKRSGEIERATRMDAAKTGDDVAVQRLARDIRSMWDGGDTEGAKELVDAVLARRDGKLTGVLGDIPDRIARGAKSLKENPALVSPADPQAEAGFNDFQRYRAEMGRWEAAEKAAKKYGVENTYPKPPKPEAMKTVEDIAGALAAKDANAGSAAMERLRESVNLGRDFPDAEAVAEAAKALPEDMRKDFTENMDAWRRYAERVSETPSIAERATRLADEVDAEIAAEERGDDGKPSAAPRGRGTGTITQDEPLPQGTKTTGKMRGIVTPQKLLKEAQKLFPDVAIRGKNTTRMPAWAAGHFEPALRVIRAKDQNSIRVLGHELGHELEYLTRYDIARTPAVKRDLSDLGHHLYAPGGPKPNSYIGEGFAEYVRGYVVNADNLSTVAPDLHAWFTGDFKKTHPDIVKKLDRLRDMVQTMKEQSAADTVRGFRNPSTGLVDRVWKKVTNFFSAENWNDSAATILRGMKKSGIDKLYHWQDDFRELEKAVKSGNSARANTLARDISDKIENHPYLFATVTRGTASQRVMDMARHGTTSLVGNKKTGESLKDIFSGFTHDEQEAWKDYAIARHGLENYYAKGLEFGIKKDTLEDVVRMYDSPKFQQALQRVTDYSHRILHLGVDAGLISNDTYDKIVAEHPIYIRVTRRKAEDGVGARQGGAAINRRTGGFENILDPIDAMLMDQEKFLRACFQAKTLQLIVGAGERAKAENAKSVKINGGPGTSTVNPPSEAHYAVAAHWPIEVKNAQEKVQFNSGKLKRGLEESVDDFANRTGVDRDVLDEFVKDLTMDNVHQMSIFRDKASNGKHNMVSVYIDGKLHTYELPDMRWANMLTDVYDKSDFNWVERAFGLATAGIRLGATTINPGFALRNGIRDSLHSAVMSETGSIPLLGTLNGMLNHLTGKEAAQMFRAMGGHMSDLMGVTKEQKWHHGGQVALAQSPIQSLQAYGAIDWMLMKPVLKSVSDVLSVPELGPRIREFNGVLKKCRDAGLSEDASAIMAMSHAKDISIDFQRAGRFMKRINHFIPFSNAMWRGTEQTLRNLGLLNSLPHQFEDRRGTHGLKTVAKGAAYVASWSMMLALAEMDGDEEQKMAAFNREPTEKWEYEHVGDWRIPLPFELGYVFGAIPKAIVYEMNGDEGAVKECLESFAKAMPTKYASPDTIIGSIAAITPWVGILTNKDYRDRSIVPQQVMENNIKTDWYTQYTTETSKRIGKLFGVSPAQLEYVLDSYTGGLYRRTAMAVENIGDTSRLREGRGLSILDTLRARPQANRLVGDFYKFEKDAKQRLGSGVITIEDYGKYASMKRVKEVLTERFGKMREIRADKTIPLADQDKKVQEISKTINDEIGKFNSRKDFRETGIAYAADHLTGSPLANLDEEKRKKYMRLLEDVDVNEAVDALVRFGHEPVMVRQRGVEVPHRRWSDKNINDRVMRMIMLMQDR